MYYMTTGVISLAGGAAAHAIAESDKGWWCFGVTIFLLILFWAREALVEIFD